VTIETTGALLGYFLAENCLNLLPTISFEHGIGLSVLVMGFQMAYSVNSTRSSDP
jgi:hypothetical protein